MHGAAKRRTMLVVREPVVIGRSSVQFRSSAPSPVESILEGFAEDGFITFRNISDAIAPSASRKSSWSAWSYRPSVTCKLECPRMSALTFADHPCLRSVVPSGCLKSCQPPILIPSERTAGRTYRLSAFPGFTGVPFPDSKIHSRPLMENSRERSASGIGRSRADFLVFVVSDLPS